MDSLNTLHFKTCKGQHDLTLERLCRSPQLRIQYTIAQHHQDCKHRSDGSNPAQETKTEPQVLSRTKDDRQKPHFVEFHPLDSEEEFFCPQCLSLIFNLREHVTLCIYCIENMASFILSMLHPIISEVSMMFCLFSICVCIYNFEGLPLQQLPSRDRGSSFSLSQATLLPNERVY